MRKRSWTAEQLIIAVRENVSKAGVLRALKLRPTGGNYSQLEKYIQELHLSTDHFTGKLWNKGLHTACSPAKALNELLIENRLINTNHLRKRLIAEGIFESKCYKCLLTRWNDLPIPLELEHINGIRADNRLVNLTILCPNCHAQTPTYRGRNKQGPLT